MDVEPRQTTQNTSRATYVVTGADGTQEKYINRDWVAWTRLKFVL